MGAVLYVILLYTPALSDLFVLVAGTIIGGLIYFGGAYLLRLDALDEFWGILKLKRKKS